MPALLSRIKKGCLAAATHPAFGFAAVNLTVAMATGAIGEAQAFGPFSMIYVAGGAVVGAMYGVAKDALLQEILHWHEALHQRLTGRLGDAHIPVLRQLRAMIPAGEGQTMANGMIGAAVVADTILAIATGGSSLTQLAPFAAGLGAAITQTGATHLADYYKRQAEANAQPHPSLAVGGAPAVAIELTRVQPGQERSQLSEAEPAHWRSATELDEKSAVPHFAITNARVIPLRMQGHSRN